jgi:phospholipid transport system substrate-binding protein
VVVQNVTDAVLAVLGDKTLTSDQKRGRIEDIVYANVDFATLSRLVLARNWSRFSDAQREDFTNEFKRHLSVTYGKNVENYRNERVAILGDREEARGDWTVQTKILRGGPDDILVDYRLRRADNRWTIIDFIVEGVSLVSNFRAQFQEIIASGGVDKLLQLLREKNATGEPLKS